MMQVAGDEIIGVITVRNRLVSTSGTVPVIRIVAIALVVRRTCRRVLRADGEHVLVHMVRVRVVQMSVVKIVRVAVVHDGRVSARPSMLVRVSGVRDVFGRAHR
jgi:hypothetical protein